MPQDILWGAPGRSYSHFTRKSRSMDNNQTLCLHCYQHSFCFPKNRLCQPPIYETTSTENTPSIPNTGPQPSISTLTSPPAESKQENHLPPPNPPHPDSLLLNATKNPSSTIQHQRTLHRLQSYHYQQPDPQTVKATSSSTNSSFQPEVVGCPLQRL